MEKTIYEVSVCLLQNYGGDYHLAYCDNMHYAEMIQKEEQKYFDSLGLKVEIYEWDIQELAETYK